MYADVSKDERSLSYATYVFDSTRSGDDGRNISYFTLCLQKPEICCIANTAEESKAEVIAAVQVAFCLENETAVDDVFRAPDVKIVKPDGKRNGRAKGKRRKK